MRFGYAFHGFLGDYKVEGGKEVSTPDGNAAYSWSILWEAQRRGWDTYLLQNDRGREGYEWHGADLFSSFSTEKRLDAYWKCESVRSSKPLDELGDLDVVLIEWRWPIPGRNTEQDRETPEYQPDLDRQTQLLEHFKERGTKVILWDLDHKLTLHDEVVWQPDAIFETAVNPRDFGSVRTRVEPPIVIGDLLQFEMLPAEPGRKIVYVGSRYERDEIIDRWITPVSVKSPFEVEFWGNWTREPGLTECRQRWPWILYNDRITMKDFRSVYSTACSCPLLGKESYMECGFVTPRVWEALMFGTIPVGLSEHLGVEQYVGPSFVAQDAEHLGDIVEWLSMIDVDDRERVRRDMVERLGFMDVSFFVNEIEKVVSV